LDFVAAGLVAFDRVEVRVVFGLDVVRALTWLDFAAGRALAVLALAVVRPLAVLALTVVASSGVATCHR
jgi:hypothetical protein